MAREDGQEDTVERAEDDGMDRRTFLGAAAVTPYAANLDVLRFQSMRTTAAPVTVSNETELNDALGNHTEIAFANDITITGTVQADLGDGDLDLDLATYTLAKADGVNDRLLDVTTTGDVVLENGRIDCNRDGQNFPTVRSKEVTFSGGGRCRVRDVTLVDNSDYGFVVADFETARFDTVTVDSHPGLLADSNDAAGLDGIHTFDCAEVRVDDPTVTAGGDGVAVAANDRSVESVAVSGGTISSPVYGNGIRLHVQSGAAPATTISNVEIDTSITDCDGQGIDVDNESTNGNAIRNLAVAGSISGVGGDGVRTLDRVENVVLLMDVTDAGANGVNVSAGGRAIGVHAAIDGASVNGVHAEDATEVVVSDSLITNCGNWPIISKGSSNRWNVVDNQWSGNRFATVELANEENHLAFNDAA